MAPKSQTFRVPTMNIFEDLKSEWTRYDMIVAKLVVEVGGMGDGEEVVIMKKR